VKPVLEIVLTLAGVVVPSAVLAAVVNRWLAPVSLRLTALLIGLVLVTLHLAVFTTAMPVPLDEVVRGYPYAGIFGGVESRNPVTNDTVKQMLPWMDAAREEIFSGRAPLWNRYAFSGTPLLGNAQSAPFSPFFLATLFVPLPKQLVAMAGLKLFTSLLFGFLFLREEGAGAVPAAAGSMVYAFSVFQNVYLYYPLSSVTCLLPALAWSVVRSMRTGARSALVTVALVTGAALSSGHPETVFHLALAAVVVMLIERLTGPSGSGLVRRSGLTIAFALLGVVLAAAVWLPAAEQILSSQRVDALAEGTVGSPAFPVIALWAAIHPDGFGNPARGNWQWMFNYPMVASTFAGLIPLMLLPGALFSSSPDRRTRLFALFAVVVFLVAMRWSFVGELFNQLPVAESAANDRLRFVALFFVAVASARRLAAIARSGPSLTDLISGLMLIVLSIYVYRKLVYATLAPEHVLGTIGLVAFVTACLAVSLSLWREWKLRGASSLPMVAAIVIGLELLLVNLPYNALTPGKYFAPKLGIVDAIHSSAPDEPFRILGFDWVFLPNASAHYALEDVRGSDPMAWAPYTRFFQRLQAEDQSLDVLRTQRQADSAVDFLNVRFLLGEPGFDPGSGWRRIYSGRDGELFENEEWVRRFFTPARLLPGQTHDARDVDDLRKAAVVDDPSLSRPTDNPTSAGMWMRQMSPTSFRLTVDAADRVFVASSQPAIRGWNVEIEGEPVEIHRVNGAFIGFWVPAGTSKVRVTYEPASWQIGLMLSFFGLAGLIAAARARMSDPLAPRIGENDREDAR
jgi:hypothetical protein